MSVDPSTHEIDVLALRHWAGRGMVEMHYHAQHSSALLLERLGGGSLDEENWRPAIEVCRELIGQTTIPACAGLPTVTNLASDIARNLERHWLSTGRSIARNRIDRVLDIVASHCSDTTDLMVNWDLYPGNVLRATRQPWIVIDPKPARGAPEFGVAPVFWRLIDFMECPADFGWAFETLVERGNLDRAKLKDWTFVRVVDYWLWALSKGLTEDPVRCSRLLNELERL